MAWTTPRTWNAGETVTSSIMNTHVRDNFNVLATFSRGGTMVNPNGITAAINIICWRAPFACVVTNVRGYRVGGTGATINARRAVGETFLSGALSLTSADTWMDGGAVQNVDVAAGGKLEIMIVSVTGSPTQIEIQIDLGLS